MVNTSLFPLDETRLINLNQIIEVERFDSINVEGEDGANESVENGAIIKMHNGTEIVLDENEATDLFAHAYELLAFAQKLQAAMNQSR